MSEVPKAVAHLRKKRFLPELSPDLALYVFRGSYVGLIIGAALVLGSTLLAFWSDNEIKFHDSIRLSANERETAQAQAEAARAIESASKLANETERLKADNLSLQTVLLPRRAGLMGFNRAAPAAEWFAGITPFAGTSLFVQFSDDKEAKNLANEIVIICLKFGWKVILIDDARSQFNSAQIADGIRVSYPIGKPWTAEEPSQPWFAWQRAAEALANGLTAAGLAVGDRPISRYGFVNEPPQVPWSAPYFTPPIEGVYLQVGARPVAETVEWIRQGRPDRLGNIPAPASNVAKPHL